MTETEHTSARPDDARLDAELRALPRALEPGRDLWPAIAGRLEPREATRRSRPAWLWQAAAAVLLVAGSSLLTATWLDSRRGDGTMATTQPSQPAVDAPSAPVQAGAGVDAGGVGAMPAAFGPGAKLDPEYLAARRQLTALLEARMASLPESTRAKLQVNLGEMRRAAEQINAALAEQPGDPLLEELLLKTYQDELAVLANVSQLTNALDATANAPAGPERMKL